MPPCKPSLRSILPRMAKVKLHLDAEPSMKSLYTALLARGLDVTRTPNSWMPQDASDE